MGKSKVIIPQEGKRLGIFGASGSGKTTLGRKIIRNSNRLIVFDSVKNEWATMGKKWLPRAHVVENWPDLKKYVFKQWQKGFQVVFRPTFGQEVKQLDQVARFIFEVQAGYGTSHQAKITLFVDEAQEAIPSGTGRNWPTHGALLLAKMGRARGINAIFASQRLKMVDIGVRANLSGIYIFRLSELADIQEANQIIMDKQKLLNMPNYHYFYKGEDGQIKFF